MFDFNRSCKSTETELDKTQIKAFRSLKLTFKYLNCYSRLSTISNDGPLPEVFGRLARRFEFRGWKEIEVGKRSEGEDHPMSLSGDKVITYFLIKVGRIDRIIGTNVAHIVPNSAPISRETQGI